jgi:outer membrane protein OmpA-like peptidoglycan-associated protein
LLLTRATQTIGSQLFMNARLIPIIAFVVWSAICWRWYVCGIKQACATDTAIAAAPVVTPIAPPEPDTAGQAAARRAIEAANTAEQKPQKTSPNATPQPSNGASAAQRELSADISSAQVIAVEDRVQIHFPYGSSRKVDDDAIDRYLSELARALVATNSQVVLTGHTDNIGDPASNVQMALQRTQHIKNILVKKGVAGRQVICKSMGESKPLASNDNPAGRYRNRRVEVRLK